MLYCQIPLRGITGAEIAIDTKNALSEARVRRQRNRSDRRPLTETKCRRHIIERALRNGLHEGKLWDRKWRGNSRLLLPDQPIPGANDGLLAEAISEPEARSKIGFMQFPRRIG